MDKVAQAKCSESPTGAHHWMLPGSGAIVQGPCKYCHQMSRPHQGVYGYLWEGKGRVSTLEAQSLMHSQALHTRHRRKNYKL